MLCAVLLQLLRDHCDELRRGDHADLHGVRENISKNSVQLLTQKIGCGLQNICDAGSILGGQGKHAVGGHGFDIGLNPGASAGIASGNGQRCFHLNTSFLFTARFYNAIQGGAPHVPPEHRVSPYHQLIWANMLSSGLNSR